MAWAASCSCTTGPMAMFGRGSPTPTRTWAKLTTRPSLAPTTTAGALGTAALVRKKTTPPLSCHRPGSSGQGRTTNTTELSFDVSLTAEDDGHFERNFLQRMRDTLSDPTADRGRCSADGRQILVLHPQTDSPVLMNLTLLAGGASVTLSVRTDNLYVVGFRNSAGAWFEIRPDDVSGRPGPRLIQGATLLPFGGSYQEGGLGLLHLDTRIFNRQTVMGAICGLARYTGRSEDNEAAKKHLRTLIVNFIESVRFHPIANIVAGQMRRNPSEASCVDWRSVDDLIHNWGRISQSWLLGIDIPYIVALAMMLVRSKVDVAAADEDFGGGLTIAEVVGVVVSNINDCNPGKLYGTITVTDGIGDVRLYSRDKDHYQEVGPGGMADLLYAHRPISGADDFVIDVDLTDHYDWIISDRKVAVGQVTWNSREALSGDYNKILTVPVYAEHGKVEVQYAVLTDAMVAKVEVQMVDTNNWVWSPDVYGSVTATTTMASGSKLEYVLFDQPKEQNHKVGKQELIPLQRNLISVPLCSKLQVSAKLWDHNMVLSDDHILDGSLDFTPGQDDHLEITGTGGKVSVRVTWSASFPQQ